MFVETIEKYRGHTIGLAHPVRGGPGGYTVTLPDGAYGGVGFADLAKARSRVDKLCERVVNSRNGPPPYT